VGLFHDQTEGNRRLMSRRRKVAVGAALAAGGLLATTAAGAWYDNADRSRDIRQAIDGGRAKNVIMFLGDGMGDSEITVARNYAVGAANRLSMDSLPLTGEYTTYAVKAGTWETPDYVTDSAASGTGWATGHKTYNNAISVDPVTKAPLYTILELAQRAGFKTGNVTTAELTDATPAVLDSHVSLRACQGPATWRRARPRPKRRAGSARSPSRPSSTTSTSSWAGASSASTRRSRAARSSARASSIDLLAQKAKADKGKGNKGFFLQVEGASIDKQDHAENPCGQIGETVEFDRSIQVALDWAKAHPDTLIIVTADHGHTSQIVEAQTDSDHSPGAVATLITADGQPMVVNYATNLDGRSQSHTGTEVRVAAQGPQAANVVGITNRTRHGWRRRPRRRPETDRPMAPMAARYATWTTMSAPTAPVVNPRSNATPWYSGVSSTTICSPRG
jgi:alkaline phosphatase